MAVNPSYEQLKKEELKADAGKRGIPTSVPISRPLSDGERSALERQLAQIQQLLTLDFSSAEFIEYAVSQNLSPEAYHEYLVRREAEISQQISTGQFYYTLPTNEFLDYVIQRYASCESSSSAYKREFNQKSKQFKIAIACIVVLVGISGFLFATRHSETSPSVVDAPPASQQITDTVPSDVSPAPESSSVNNVPASEESQFTPLPYPENGTILADSGLSRVAPLEIKTAEGLAYYVKLCDMSGNEVLGFFVGPNTSVEVSAPLGTYELRYACGTAWYGTTPKFGESTQYYKIDTLLDFTDDGTYYNGHTITMYSVPGGNLNTESIDPEDF